jgi:hypothetical protein
MAREAYALCRMHPDSLWNKGRLLWKKKSHLNLTRTQKIPVQTFHRVPKMSSPDLIAPLALAHVRDQCQAPTLIVEGTLLQDVPTAPRLPLHLGTVHHLGFGSPAVIVVDL